MLSTALVSIWQSMILGICLGLLGKLACEVTCSSMCNESLCTSFKNLKVASLLVCVGYQAYILLKRKWNKGMSHIGCVVCVCALIIKLHEPKGC